jgi:hypothetical protein
MRKNRTGACRWPAGYGQHPWSKMTLRGEVEQGRPRSQLRRGAMVRSAIHANGTIAKATGFGVTWISYGANLLGAVMTTYNPE